MVRNVTAMLDIAICCRAYSSASARFVASSSPPAGGGNTCSQCVFNSTFIRFGSQFTPWTVFNFLINANLNIINNTAWSNYDFTGQVRYAVASGCFGNRLSDSFNALQVGASNGIVGPTGLVNGANANVVLPLDGAIFLLQGPSAAFSISGFVGGYDGRLLTIINQSGQTVTVTMEDAATAEISRAQVWQWIHHGVTTAEGTLVTVEWVDGLVDEELAKIEASTGAAFGRFRWAEAAHIFREVALGATFPNFLTLPAYEILG